MTKYDYIWYIALQKNDAIFDYAMIEIQYTCLYSAVPPYVTDAAADVESIQQERSCSHPPQCSLPSKESIHPQKHCEI